MPLLPPVTIATLGPPSTGEEPNVTTIFYDGDADLGVLDGGRVAVVGYGNQGRSWALNLRDSGLDVVACVRNDATREQAVEDGFAAAEVEAASEADVICILIPDDAIPLVPLSPKPDALVIVASGYTLAFDRLDPACDSGMRAPAPRLAPAGGGRVGGGGGAVAPGPVGVHRDLTGTAQARLLAIAKAIGG